MSKLFTPLYDRILVQRDEDETVLAGNIAIVIPENSTEKPDRGTILAVGHGRLLENGQVVPLLVKAGDRILFNKYAGTEIKLDGKEYIIMSEPEVYGVL